MGAEDVWQWTQGVLDANVVSVQLATSRYVAIDTSCPRCRCGIQPFTAGALRGRQHCARAAGTEETVTSCGSNAARVSVGEWVCLTTSVLRVASYA